MARLRSGTDLEWLRANAPRRLQPADAPLVLDGAPVSAGAMPASLAAALAGAKRGDVKVWVRDDGKQAYVVRVIETLPPQVKPYAEVREQLAREVEAERVAAALREYAAKLRAVQKVDVLVVRISA